MKKLFQPGPVARISTGVVSLLLALILLADATLGVLPNPRQRDVEHRTQVVNLIGAQINLALSAGDRQALQTLIDTLVAATPELRSIGVRPADGALLAATPGHQQAWDGMHEAGNRHDGVELQVHANDRPWGRIELLFKPADGSIVRALLREPSLALSLLLGSAGLLSVYLYLRRALYQLNPSNAVPQHVRNAFATLAESVLILDRKGRLMLANASFARMSGMEAEQLEGKPFERLQWLCAEVEQAIGPFSLWDAALGKTDGPETREIEVTLPNGAPVRLQLNCSAIHDGSHIARGYLLSFNDVTELSTANTRLRQALRELEASRDQIERQNAELQKHAHHDHLTGCLNRRAFFERAEPMFARSMVERADFSCIMVDIDHFKSFNDTYGHAVGDLVIQQVAQTLARGLRGNDILCRFGGEEFCIVLPGANRENGLAVAERLRALIERECGPGVQAVENLRITASLGFASLDVMRDVTTLQALIERADQGLYAAKRGGRNRVGDGALVTPEAAA